MSTATLQAAPAVAAEPVAPEWRPLLIVRLALADLRHDAGFMASLVIGVAAVIAPLLLILGLKFGLVEIQRQCLVQDPVYREMRPVQRLSRNSA
jgi:putative ABC transport system permease protein